MLMDTARVLRDVSIAVLMTMVVMLLLWARWNPEEYGRWLQAVDTARYEHLDCDCTGEWAEETLP
jgi:hypothetical protein